MEQETAKKPQLKSNKIYMIIAIVIMIGVVIGYYMYFESSHYFVTDNTKVSAQMYNITPLTAGKLVKYTVRSGSTVSANQVIGRVENGGYIRSPIDGMVVKSNVTVNQLVSPSSPIAVIADVENIYIGANIEETQTA
jgi:multidrug resistance efflux pump